MSEQTNNYAGTRFLVTAASFVIIVAGMRSASIIIVPFLLSAFFACICAVPMGWLQNKGVPSPIAITIVVLGFIAAVMFVGGLVGSSLDGFLSALPGYQTRLQQDAMAVVNWLKARDVKVSSRVVLEYFDPGAAMRFIGGLLSAMTGMLTNAFMILVTMVFMLAEITALPKRLARVVDDPETSFANLRHFSESLNRYLAIKTIVSVATALLVGLWLYLLGVDFPLLWAVLAFFLNYVPNLGPIIASVPPVLLGLIQLGPGTAVGVVVGFTIVNIVMGSGVEPRFMGEGLGLSTLVVFLSLAFWGWVLGPVGMLLSVPLTMTVKIALESSEDLRWLAVLLGPGGPRHS